MSALELAQQRRVERGLRLSDRQMDVLLDSIGLSEAEIERRVQLGTADVSPAARKKLKGIIGRLRVNPHPFTQCMADLRKHKPEWDDKRRKETCNVLKALAGRSTNSVKTSNDAMSACVMLEDDVAALLMMVDKDALSRALGKEG